MILPRQARFREGQHVLAAVDMYNDGSFPNQPPEALLVSVGQTGLIVQVGAHVEANVPVYMVEFSPDRVIGCLEEEIGIP